MHLSREKIEFWIFPLKKKVVTNFVKITSTKYLTISMKIFKEPCLEAHAECRTPNSKSGIFRTIWNSASSVNSRFTSGKWHIVTAAWTGNRLALTNRGSIGGILLKNNRKFLIKYVVVSQKKKENIKNISHFR